jgi:hypothetical protein
MKGTVPIRDRKSLFKQTQLIKERHTATVRHRRRLRVAVIHDQAEPDLRVSGVMFNL